MDGAERRQGLGFREVGEQVQQDGGVEATGEGDAPGGGVAPRGKIQQKPGGKSIVD